MSDARGGTGGPQPGAQGEGDAELRAHEGTATAGRTLLLVTGPHAGGLRTVAGVLRRLGATVPQPEHGIDEVVPQRPSSPRWVTDFHDRLIGYARTLATDAQPRAWLRNGVVARRADLRAELADWLATAFAESATPVVSDPRLGWFLSLWQEAAADVDAAATVVVPVRHPATVVRHRQQIDPAPGGHQHLLASWVNLMTGLEHRTRDVRRVLVDHDALVRTPRAPLERLAAVTGLPLADPAGRAVLPRFLDRIDLTPASWADLSVGADLRRIAAVAWDQLDRLTDPASPEADSRGRLDEIRAEYAAYYAGEEALVQSSITAATWQGTVERRRRLDRLAATAPAQNS